MTFDISVIVPTYNRAHLIGATLRSILAQRHEAAEIIVVDDGSTDNTAAVVADFPAVRYHRIRNSGVCRARNEGVNRARGRWIAFCDSDDLWRKDRLETQARLLARAPDVEYCFTNFATVTDESWSSHSKFDQMPADYWALPLSDMDADGFVVRARLYNRILRFQPIFPSTLLMTRDFFSRVGAFNEALSRNPSEDLEFTLRCVQEGPAGVVAEPVVGIRKHTGNFSGNILRRLLGEIDILHYAQQHHPAARRCADLLADEIMRRRCDALAAAFSAGNLSVVREISQGLPLGRRGLKLALKCLIASLPEVVGGRLHAFLSGPVPQTASGV